MPVYNLQCPANSPATSQQVLCSQGALLLCEVSVPTSFAAALQKANKPVPPSQQGPILIDTGATSTCINDAILKGLNLTPINQVSVLTPSGSAKQYVYLAKIEFLGTPIPPLEIPIIGADLKGQNIIGLFGRDILKHFILIMNGPGGHFSLAF